MLAIKLEFRFQSSCRVVYLNSVLSSHGASFHPGVEMGTSELLGKPDEILGCPWMIYHFIPGGRWSGRYDNTLGRFMLQRL